MAKQGNGLTPHAQKRDNLLQTSTHPFNYKIHRSYPRTGGEILLKLAASCKQGTSEGGGQNPRISPLAFVVLAPWRAHYLVMIAHFWFNIMHWRLFMPTSPARNPVKSLTCPLACKQHEHFFSGRDNEHCHYNPCIGRRVFLTLKVNV